MRQIIVAGLVGLICAVSAAGAQAPASPTPAETVAGRKAAFNLSGAAVGAMKGTIDAGAPVQQQAFAARSLTGWARALPGMFPAGTSEADMPGATRAKANIWTDRAGFEAKAADYAAAAQVLNDLARANDTAGFAAQWAVVRETCNACHTVYRSDPPAA